MKASFENHDKVVQLLATAGATLNLLHRVCVYDLSDKLCK